MNEVANKMIQKLIEIYELSKLNKGKNECIFPETLIFNEGWLLRSILNSLMEVKEIKDKSLSDFLPFPIDSKRYSEARLDTPFKPIEQGDKTSTESQTPIDGIVGDFEIDETTKSGIKIFDNFEYLSIFEAKMYSQLKQGTTNESNFSQVTRIISCLIFNLMKIESLEGKKIFFIIFYPKDNTKIDRSKYSIDFIKTEIKNRILKYKNDDNERISEDLKEFESKYEKIIEIINLKFICWETILNEIKDDTLIFNFYDLCKKFNNNVNREYQLKEFPHKLDELRKLCPVYHKKSLEWINENCISKSEIPKKCITTGLNGGLPIKTIDGFYIRLSPKYDARLWKKLKII